jgi:hypothetical protein
MNDLFEFPPIIGTATNRGEVVICFHGGADRIRAATSLETLALDAVAPWVLSAVKKLERLGDLREGWDSHGGRPLRAEAKNATVRAIGFLHRTRLPIPGVVLASDGGVSLEWRSRGKELEVEVGEDGTFEYVQSETGGQISEGHVEKYDQDKLRFLADWLILT